MSHSLIKNYLTQIYYQLYYIENHLESFFNQDNYQKLSINQELPYPSLSSTISHLKLSREFP